MCRWGETEIAQWIYDLSRGDPKALEKEKEMLYKDKSQDESKNEDELRESPKKRVKLDNSCCNKMQKVIIDESVFSLSCWRGHTETAKWLYETSKKHGNKKININQDEERAFEQSCEAGHLDTAKWLYELSQTDGNNKINIHAGYEEEIFRSACTRGHKDVAKWLYELSIEDENNNYDFDNDNDENKRININAFDDSAFKYACYYGHLDVAQWLYELSQEFGNTLIDVRSEDDFAFKKSYYYGNDNVLDWLCTICPDYVKVTENGKAVYRIKNSIEELERSPQFIEQDFFKLLCTLIAGPNKP